MIEHYSLFSDAIISSSLPLSRGINGRSSLSAHSHELALILMRYFSHTINLPSIIDVFKDLSYL